MQQIEYEQLAELLEKFMKERDIPAVVFKNIVGNEIHYIKESLHYVGTGPNFFHAFLKLPKI